MSQASCLELGEVVPVATVIIVTKIFFGFDRNYTDITYQYTVHYVITVKSNTKKATIITDATVHSALLASTSMQKHMAM